MPSQGENATFVAEFFQYAGGPAIDVTNLKYTIYKLSDNSIVLGPSSVGINHVATGVYSFTWAIPLVQTVGQYLILWTSTEAQAPEQFSVLAASTGQGVLGGPCNGWDAPIWTCALDPASQAVSGHAVQAASEVLYALTGRHLGTCQLTIRPCRRTCWDTSWPFFNQWWQFGYWPRPLFFDGVWYNITCAGCPNGECSCSVIQEAVMPAPVAQILQVKVDGTVLDPSAYRVDNWRKLVRIDGGQWPICNDLTKDDSQSGTWSVTLTYGEQVSTLGQMALGELATQFAKLLACNEDCLLPKPVQQIIRQGVTTNFLDPNMVFADGRIGLYLTDLFISVENPSKLMNAPVVYDIDHSDYRITNT